MAQALLAAGKAGDVVEMLRQYFVAKKFMAGCAGNRFSEQAIAPLYTLSRRFYFMHHRELDDLREVARMHADLLRAVATGDEKEAVVASDRHIDFAESFAKRIITRGLLSDSRASGAWPLTYHQYGEYRSAVRSVAGIGSSAGDAMH